MSYANLPPLNAAELGVLARALYLYEQSIILNTAAGYDVPLEYAEDGPIARSLLTAVQEAGYTL